MEYKPQRITLRIPAELHEKLLAESEESCRSMNAEILARLQESFSTRDQSDLKAIKEAVIETIKKELSKK